MQFTNVTLDAGIDHQFSPAPDHCAINGPFGDTKKMPAGAVAEDFNGDGHVDLYVLQSGVTPNLMYINQGDGTFHEEAAPRGADLAGFAMGAAAADYDNDGDVDICFTYCSAPHVLLINDGTGHFTIDIETLTVPESSVMGPAWGDVDNDGLLELAIGQWNELPQNFYLYKNLGGGGLEPYEFRAEPHRDVFIFSPRFADLNNDGLVDLVLVCDFRKTQFYLNNGDGQFRNVTGTNVTITDQHGMGHTIGDFNNDGSLDVFVSSIFNSSENGSALYRNQGDGTFVDIAAAAGVVDGFWGWGSSFGDLDNDGDLDLYHVNGFPFAWESGKPARLFENLGDETFDEVAASAGADDKGQGRGVILFDYDNDGDLDIFIANFEETLFDEFRPIGVVPGLPVLLRNDTVSSNHWLKVTLDGEPPLHRHGIGSRVHVTTGATVQMRELDASSNFLAQNPGRIAHFGLGPHETIDEVRAQWVNGDATLLTDVVADQALALPSPAAQISSRLVEVGAEVTASAAQVGPPGALREWVIDDQIHDDPVTHAFDQPGDKQLRLNIYTPDGTTLVRAEIYRIRVVVTIAVELSDFSLD